MKRFFTLFIAILALLSISQTVKATDYYYITGSFDKTAAWTKLDGQNMTSLGGEKYSQEYKCTTSGEYRFRFTGNDWNGTEMCPDQESYILTDAIPSYEIHHYTNESKYKDYYFIVNMESGKTYTFTFDNSDVTKRTVACTVSGSTSSSEFEKLYLIGGLYNDWHDDTTRPFTTTDGKIYQYVFDADYTNSFSKESDDYYFRLKTATSQYYPQTNDAPVETTFTSANEGSSNNAWKFTMTKGKSYTLIFDYENKQIKYSEGGSEVVTKVIKLLNGETELTGSNGKYTLDLSSATATDATIKLTIDDVTYGLATAQTIAAAGTTSDIAFTAEGTEALTLKAGLIYSLSVTEDGKMTVVAKEKGVSNSNYYLVGNFFTEDGDKINLDKKYFRFINSKGDGTLSFDIPATLSVKAQVYASDGRCYGPKENGNISSSYPSATVKTVDGLLADGNNYYWNFTARDLSETGIYTITITVDAAGVPTAWNVTYDKSKRMAYFLVDPTDDPDAVAQPCYAVKKDDGGCDNKFFGNIYLKKGHHCFVVGNIMKSSDDNIAGHPRRTTPKLYMQGNGGLDPTTKVQDSERSKYTKVYPNKAKGFTYNETMSMVLEYNPTQGDDTYLENNPDCFGIGGEIIKASTQISDYDDPITSIQIVGNGVVDSWELDKAQNMTYNKILDCWEYTFRTEKAESTDNKFRFIANKGWKYNWGEESLEKKDQARPSTDTNPENGHEASLKDPNELGFTKNGSAANKNVADAYDDMIFNRPAGNWTIRFYIRTVSENGGNDYKARYAYTITGSESKDIYLTYRKDRFIRTYSNDKPMNPDNDNVKIYEVYKYVNPDGGSADNIYEKGTVHLRRLKYVPANVGVVLIGEAPAGIHKDGDNLKFSLLERTEESVEPGGDYRTVWTKSADYIAENDQWNNYLVPTVTAVNNLGNVKVESGKITHRYFGLGNYYRTNYHKSLGDTDPQEDYIGFFRFTANGRSGANKAYLSIPANAEVDNCVGATYGYIDYNGQLLGNEYDDKENNIPAQFAKMALVFDDMVDGNETTGIKELETKKMNNNKYYNLQGIEVAHPVKGIYIHNGKKVIVK